MKKSVFFQHCKEYGDYLRFLNDVSNKNWHCLGTFSYLAVKNPCSVKPIRDEIQTKSKFQTIDKRISALITINGIFLKIGSSRRSGVDNISWFAFFEERFRKYIFVQRKII